MNVINIFNGRVTEIAVAEVQGGSLRGYTEREVRKDGKPDKRCHGIWIGLKKRTYTPDHIDGTYTEPPADDKRGQELRDRLKAASKAVDDIRAELSAHYYALQQTRPDSQTYDRPDKGN